MESKLPIYVKLCYGAGSLGKVVQGLAGSTFLLYFYTEILGVRPGLAGSIIFFGKLFDIINDPLIGTAVDKTRSKTGMCRIYLKYCAVPTGICLALCFISPNFSMTGKVVWIALTYGIMTTASSFIQIPMNTLMGRLSQDKQQRVHLNQFSGIVSLLANFFIVSWTLPAAAFFGSGDMQKGFGAVGIIYGIIYALAYLVVFWGTKGYETQEAEKQALPEKASAGLSDIPGSLLQNKIWICIGLYYLLDMTATTLESTAMIYYFQYNLNDTDLLGTYSAVAMLCNGLIFLFLHLFTEHLGNGGTTILGCILSMSGDLFRFLMHDATFAVILTGWVLSALGSCMVAGTVLLNLFDAKTYGEWKTGIKSEAILMSGFTLATKVGMAIGSAMMGWVLALVPYNEGMETQPQSVLDLFFFMNTLMPAVVFFAVLLLSIPVCQTEKKLPQMRREIEKRQQKN